jgi:hypothetical protein
MAEDTPIHERLTPEPAHHQMRPTEPEPETPEQPMPAGTEALVRWLDSRFPPTSFDLMSIANETKRLELAYAMGRRDAIVRIAELWTERKDQINEHTQRPGPAAAGPTAGD